MKDMKNVENKFIFSSLLENVKNTAIQRMGPYNDRENTVGMPPDGKTPFFDAFVELEGKVSYAEAFAEGIKRSWTETEPIFYDGEIIVGTPRAIRPFCEHFSWGLQYDDKILNHHRYRRKKKEITKKVQEMSSWLFPLGGEHINDEGVRIFGEDIYYTLEGSLWHVGGYQGHTVPNYEKLLRLGIEGTLDEIDYYASQTNDEKKLELYRALTILLNGFSEWVLIYAQKADELAIRADNENDKDRLLKIAENCRSIARKKPVTLYQAAQLTWFYALWDWVDCMGRMDQFLLPFYQETVRAGDVFSKEDTMSAIMLKMMEHGIHNITLGGVKPETGEDATNELTFLILQIQRTIHQPHPRLSIRIHDNSPKELMAMAVQMWSEGMSDPSVVSDKTVVAGLMEYGVPLNDARDYTMLGCQEIEIPGKSNFGCEDGLFNLAKVFEYTINDGKCRFTGKQVGLKTGYLTDYSSIEDLWDAYMKQIRYLLPIFIKLCNLGVEIRSANLSKLVKMPYTENCIEKGLNPDNGGALYNFGVVETAGSSVVADSFAAIQRLVFEEKRLKMEELKEAIDKNFEGYEKTRQTLLNMAPKFGNDDELVDKYGYRVLDSFWSELRKYKSIRGDVFMGACSLLMQGSFYGDQTWAMPDGRFKGEPLGNTIGPRTGADKSGVTAMLNSVAKLPLQMGVGGTTLNVLLPKKILQSEFLRKDIESIMTTYLLNGGQMAQITTADIEDMKDAQINPDNHKDLIVRVGGFSIHFNELASYLQNEIIHRYSV